MHISRRAFFARKYALGTTGFTVILRVDTNEHESLFICGNLCNLRIQQEKHMSKLEIVEKYLEILFSNGNPDELEKIFSSDLQFR